MRCRDVERLCSGYVDGELDDGRASALRGHLRTCPACLARVEDEAAVRDAADELGPIEPPATLWAGVQARLAEAEIADAGRSRLWMWWQRLRPAALPAAVAVMAAAALAAWLLPRGGAPVPPAPRPAAVADVDREAGPPAPSFELDFETARIEELRRADERYGTVLEELRELWADERAEWPEEVAATFDARLRELQSEARRHRGALGVIAGEPPDPRGRDALYAVYQAEIDLLQQAVLGEVGR
jgi:hypothetical protein